MKTITFSSIKGGTGKSSLCILTANHAAAAGYRVLVADLDLQNSATSYYLDAPEPAEEKNIAAALSAGKIARNIIPSNYMGIDLLASSFGLMKLRALPEKTLARMLAAEPLPYDFLFIDTPRKVNNPDYQKLGFEPLEVFIRREIGTVISPEHLEDAPGAVARLCQNPQAFAEKIREARPES